MDLFERPDSSLNADQLDFKYNPDGDGEHPVHTRALWREAVVAEKTLSGYWNWVARNVRMV